MPPDCGDQLLKVVEHEGVRRARRESAAALTGQWGVQGGVAVLGQPEGNARLNGGVSKTERNEQEAAASARRLVAERPAAKLGGTAPEPVLPKLDLVGEPSGQPLASRCW